MPEVWKNPQIFNFIQKWAITPKIAYFYQNFENALICKPFNIFQPNFQLLFFVHMLIDPPSLNQIKAILNFNPKVLVNPPNDPLCESTRIESIKLFLMTFERSDCQFIFT